MESEAPSPYERAAQPGGTEISRLWRLRSDWPPDAVESRPPEPDILLSRESQGHTPG